MVITWQRGSEVEDRIKFANLVTLKYRLFWFIQVGSIPWILKCGGGRQQSQCQSDAERETRPATAGLEDGRGFKPRNSGSLRKLEKARKWTHPRAPPHQKAALITSYFSPVRAASGSDFKNCEIKFVLF